jgi:diguanylate cyclase
MSRHAFWTMVRRVTLVAAGIDLAFLLIFWLLDSPILAWMNLISISMYLGAFWALKRRFNNVALALIWAEILGHAAIGSMLVGWDSGFHYYLLMFIPAIVVSGRSPTSGRLLLLMLLGFYLGLHAVSRALGVMAPLSAQGLAAVHAFNVVIVFGMASYTARFYYGVIRRAEKSLVELAMRDPLTGLSNRRSLITQAEREKARARRSGEPISVIIADIDHFKQINDQFGHDVGDRVIAHADSLMQQLCRSEDVVARWGGRRVLVIAAHDRHQRG